MDATGQVSHCWRRSPKTMAEAINELSDSRGGHAMTTTFRLMESMRAEFKSKPRSHKPDCRSRRMQSKNTASTALCTMRNTAHRRGARSREVQSRERNNLTG